MLISSCTFHVDFLSETIDFSNISARSLNSKLSRYLPIVNSLTFHQPETILANFNNSNQMTSKPQDGYMYQQESFKPSATIKIIFPDFDKKFKVFLSSNWMLANWTPANQFKYLEFYDWPLNFISLFLLYLTSDKPGTDSLFNPERWTVEKASICLQIMYTYSFFCKKDKLTHSRP